MGRYWSTYSFQKTKFSPLVIDLTSYLSITMRNTTCEIESMVGTSLYQSSLGTSSTKSKSPMIFDGSTTVKTLGNYHIESLHETPYIVLLQVGVSNPHQRRASNKKKGVNWNKQSLLNMCEYCIQLSQLFCKIQ